ncbi:unnamed protein product [Durusdinium trenchii]|uniref:Uncharacterized protein n=1 Tax=Durusdinium trenchii TaxID=1381693 RepID=A0ABP0K3L5_9DINO
MADPYTCIVKKNRKYSSECTEVHLANLGAETLSKNFEHFGNLEVVWLQGNQLSRVENLESNFRIREIYLQNNRLVSLAGLRSFKFLKVLLASGNQLRNLEKQLALLSRFAFLKKLDLFDNPVAEEPDYRLRLIYQLPQVEILDQHSVKSAERQRADEVVPNLDKVSAARVEKVKSKEQGFSLLERQCIREARQIRDRRRKEEEALLMRSIRVAPEVGPPDCKVFRWNRERWSDPRMKLQHEQTRPTPWECMEIQSWIEKKSEKKQLNKEDVEALAKELSSEGIVEFGRYLKTGGVFQENPWEDTSQETSMLGRTLKFHQEKMGQVAVEVHPLAKLQQDPEATMPLATVAKLLLKLEWPRFDDRFLERRIEQLYDDLRRADFAGDKEAVAKFRTQALRLEGVKSLKEHVELNRKETNLAPEKGRMDLFPQKFIRAKRQIDESTGRIVLKVGMDMRCTSLGSMTVRS